MILRVPNIAIRAMFIVIGILLIAGVLQPPRVPM